MREWSKMWAPYDEDTYQLALTHVRAGSTVLDIGAGDLRFARRTAAKGCRVIAIENQLAIIRQGLMDGPLPENLEVVFDDARYYPFPTGIDTAVLLMRHCNMFGLLVEKLRACGCQKLITNARWRMGVEAVPLACAAQFSPDRPGWYACVRCGHVGFIMGDPTLFTEENADRYTNVEGCDHCLSGSPSSDFI